jgi:hypothetical protein
VDQQISEIHKDDTKSELLTQGSRMPQNVELRNRPKYAVSHRNFLTFHKNVNTSTVPWRLLKKSFAVFIV